MEQTDVIPARKGITSTGLKIIAITAMFIDHFAAVMVENAAETLEKSGGEGSGMQQWLYANVGTMSLDAIDVILRLFIGRFGFPLFAFLIVEGFTHTKSVPKYALRLGVFALISELPFNLGFSSKLFYPGYQNVFFTLLFGLLCLASIQFLCEKKKVPAKLWPFSYVAAFLGGMFIMHLCLDVFSSVRIILDIIGITFDTTEYVIALGMGGILCTLAYVFFSRRWDAEKKNTFTFTILPIIVFCMLGDFLITDYMSGGVLTIVVMYLLRKNRKKAFAFGCLTLTILSPEEITAFLMLNPISKYNGKKGGGKINRYVFYAFYPVHIGLLYLLTLLLGLTTFAIR